MLTFSRASLVIGAACRAMLIRRHGLNGEVSPTGHDLSPLEKFIASSHAIKQQPFL